jgi:O-acetyl-ADP-ribose deacetylase
MKVFISHVFADEDKELVSMLHEILMEQGIRSYLAEKDPKFGERIDKKIEKEISESDFLIAIYTKNAKMSPTVNYEIGYARGKNIRIIVMLEKGMTLPVLIAPREGEEFTRENFSAHCKRVRKYILEDIDVWIKEIQNGKILRLVNGDITKSKMDVIVSSANSDLKNRVGLAKSIVTKGGYEIQKECDKIKTVPIGSAAITTAGRLPFKSVIHAVGPRMGEGDENNKLTNAVKSSLTLASQKNFKSISLPALSSGTKGFPKDRCAEILVLESMKFFSENPKTTLDTIEFCTSDEKTIKYFKNQFDLI